MNRKKPYLFPICSLTTTTTPSDESFRHAVKSCSLRDPSSALLIRFLNEELTLASEIRYCFSLSLELCGAWDMDGRQPKDLKTYSMKRCGKRARDMVYHVDQLLLLLRQCWLRGCRQREVKDPSTHGFDLVGIWRLWGSTGGEKGGARAVIGAL